MSGEHSAAERHHGSAGRPQGEAHLDVARAMQQLKPFLDLSLREMKLALEYEIVTVPNPESERDGMDVTVAFHGADQDLLLEKNAELLLALEYFGASLASAGPPVARPRAVRLRGLPRRSS